MNLRVYEPSFQGRKKEYLYGLKKAANNVRSYSISSQSHLQRPGENSNEKVYEASAKAYLDILSNDFQFWNYAYCFREKDIISIKKTLMPQDDLGIKPLDNFRKFLEDVMNKNAENTDRFKHCAEHLLEILA